MPTETIQPHRFHFRSADGLRIACARWSRAGPVRGIVQIAHGMGEHVDRYFDLIRPLTDGGLVVYGNDHRGHGLTALLLRNFGDFGPGGFNLLVDDTVRLSEIARQEHPGVPLVLLGHSMGSFAAQQYVLDHSDLINGLALSGSGALDSLASLAHSCQRACPEMLNAPFEPARTPHDWLSRDPAAVDQFMDDPLCFAFLQPHALESFLSAAMIVTDPARLRRIRRDLPIYVFSGSEDPVGQQLKGVRVLIRRYRAAGICDVKHHFYPGARHEVLKEINSGEVRKNLLRWIDRVVRTSSHKLDTVPVTKEVELHAE